MTLPIVAAIFGGYRTISGPVIGALVVYLADQLVFKTIMPTGHQLVLGVLLVVMIVFSPSGLMSLLKRKADGERMLELAIVSVRFGGLTAVNDVTLTDRQPTTSLGLVGSNGAGKTTLFNAISGLVTPTAGRIRFDGTRHAAARRCTAARASASAAPSRSRSRCTN